MSRIPPFIKIFFVADIIISLAYIGNNAIGKPSRFLTHMVKLSGEANLPAWYSSTQLFLIAVLLAAFTYEKFEKADRGSWILLFVPTVFFLLSLDEIAQIHEWVGLRSDVLLPFGDRKSSVFPRTGIWMFLIGPPFLGLMLFLWSRVKQYVQGRPDVSRKFVVGFIVFLASATFGDLMGNFTVGNEIANIFWNVSEETGEMLGVTIILWATYDLLIAHHFSLMSSNSGLLKPGSDS